MKGCVFVTFRKNSSFPLETETDTLFTFLYDKFRTTIKSTDLRQTDCFYKRKESLDTKKYKPYKTNT